MSFSRKGSIKDAKLSRPQETHTITTPSSKLRSKMLYYYYATHKANSLKLSSSRSWRKKRSQHQLYANSNRLCVKTLWNFWVRHSSTTAKVELLYRKVSRGGTPYQWKLRHQMVLFPYRLPPGLLAHEMNRSHKKCLLMMENIIHVSFNCSTSCRNIGV